MTPFELRDTLESMVVLYDTREQQTERLRKRLASMPCQTRREKLDSGDYSCECTLPDGSIYSLVNAVVIERKMSLDEVCSNFTRERNRFSREFTRIQENGGKSYLLVENGSWEKVYAGQYRSRVHPNALVASMKAWEARYGAHILFCSPELTGKLIYHTLYYELKERLEAGLYT